MSPYNPNGIWTSRENPNLPGAARSVAPQKTVAPEAVTVPGTVAESVSPPPEQPSSSAQPSGQPPHRRSFMSRWGLWVFGIGIVVVIGGAAAAAIIMRPPGQPAATLTITPPSDITVGTPFTVSISAANNSNVALSNAVVALQLPQGVSFVGDDSSTQVKELPVGDLAPGAVTSETSTLIVTGPASQLYALSAKLLYGTQQTPSATYEIDQKTGFTPDASPFSLSYSAPTSIVSGQAFPVTVTYANNGSQTIADAKIVLQYPPAYTFQSSSAPLATGTPAVASSEGTWELGQLAPGQGGSFIVTGAIVGPSQAQYQFTGTAYTAEGGQEYAANVQPVAFTLVPSPLELLVTANNTSSYVSTIGDSIHYTLTYTNNSAVTLASVKITAALSGRMYDFASLHTAGAFNSRTDTITWYAANTPALASLAPGQSGSVSFDIKTQSSFPIRLASDKDYVLSQTDSIQSPTVIPGASGSSTVSVITASNKVGGEMLFASKGYLKSGPYPPKVNAQSEYTIDWVITDYSTDVSGVTVSAYLQSGTTFLGAASSTGTTSTPSYDAGTGLVTWTIPSVPAGAGILSVPVKAEFTVANTPAVNQVGSNVTLLGKAVLTASDTWTGGSFTISADPVTTELPDDPGISTKISRTVVQ